MEADLVDRRLFPAIDRLFLVFVALELVAFVLLPFGPLLVAAAAEATALRRSRSRMVWLWALGIVLTLVVLLPFVLGLFAFDSVDEGPVQFAN